MHIVGYALAGIAITYMAWRACQPPPEPVVMTWQHFKGWVKTYPPFSIDMIEVPSDKPGERKFRMEALYGPMNGARRAFVYESELHPHEVEAYDAENAR